MSTRMMRLFHKVIVLQIIKAPPIIWRDHPWTRFILLDSSAWPVPLSPKNKPHICNIMKKVVSFYYKFLRTNHARSAYYHFGTTLHFSFYCKYGICFWWWRDRPSWCVQKGRNSSRDGLFKLWEGPFIICNTIALWNNYVIRVDMHIKRVDCLYNSINRCMIRLWWSRAMFIEVKVLNRSRLPLTFRVVHCTGL